MNRPSGRKSGELGHPLAIHCPLAVMIEVECANLCGCDTDQQRLVAAVRAVLQDAGVASAEVSLTIVDNAQMHELNRQHLQHDYPTDVLSFLLERYGDHLEGEVIVSADYAAEEAKKYRWSSDEELLLYAVHGALHLVGYDDSSPQASADMRRQEREILGRFGLNPPGRE